MEYKISANKSKIYTILIVLVTSLLIAAIAVDAGRGRGGGGDPAPPPPPCQQQIQGCYNKDGFRDNQGSLTQSSFSYYLDQNACIGSGCTCSASGFVNNVKQVDPDKTSGACSCISGSSWDTAGNCCGDDSLDCGIIKSGSLCSIDKNFRISSWFQAEPNKGEIVYAGCQNMEYLSDGNSWASCTKEPFLKKINSHEYLCLGSEESCQDLFWKPDTNEMVSGSIFNQVSNCKRVRTAIGTKCIQGLVVGTSEISYTEKTATETYTEQVCSGGDSGGCTDVERTRTVFAGTCPSCSNPTGDAKCIQTNNTLCGPITALSCPGNSIPKVISSSGTKFNDGHFQKEIVSCELSCTETTQQSQQTSQDNSSFFESSKGSIAECCGTSKCNSKNDGKRMVAGDSVKVSRVLTLSTSSGTTEFSIQQPTGQTFGNTPLTSCTDTTWLPDPSTIEQGQVFIQKSNCDNTRQSTGTKPISQTPSTAQPAEQTFTNVRHNGFVIAASNFAMVATQFCKDNAYETSVSHTTQANPIKSSSEYRHATYCDGTSSNTLCITQSGVLTQGWWLKTITINGQPAAWYDQVLNNIICKRG